MYCLAIVRSSVALVTRARESYRWKPCLWQVHERGGQSCLGTKKIETETGRVKRGVQRTKNNTKGPEKFLTRARLTVKARVEVLGFQEWGLEKQISTVS